MKTNLSRPFIRKELLMLAINISDAIITGIACFGLFIGLCRYFIGNLPIYNLSEEFRINTESLILGSGIMLVVCTITYHIHKYDANKINKEDS